MLVVNGKVVGCMMRQSVDDDFRANITRGGEGIPYQIDEQIEWLGGECARLLNLDIAGVDLLESERGALVLEVNSSPGLEGIEAASGVNVAGAIIDHCIANQGFSTVNLDQLLRSRPDHGVVSVSIARHPILNGKQM